MLFVLYVYKRDHIAEQRFKRGFHWCLIEIETWEHRYQKAIDMNYATELGISQYKSKQDRYRIFQDDHIEIFL